MFDKRRLDLLDICTIQAGMLDMVQQSVTPVQTVLQVVNGQAVWPTKQHISEYLKRVKIMLFSYFSIYTAYQVLTFSKAAILTLYTIKLFIVYPMKRGCADKILYTTTMYNICTICTVFTMYWICTLCTLINL